MISTILIDLDDVLADFTGGYCKLIGVDVKELRKVQLYTDGWAPYEGLRRLPGLENMELSDFWHPLIGDSDWWSALDPTPWFHNLLLACGQFTGDIWIATAPGVCASSYYGKIKWMKRWMGGDFDRFHITPHKERLALPGTVLIDDRVATVEKFIAKGLKGVTRDMGVDGILFPAIYNRNSAWAECDDVKVDYVIQQLTRIEHPDTDY